MPTIADDRQWVIDQYDYLFGRQPTAAEVDRATAFIRGGYSRAYWLGIAERTATREDVSRLYRNALGREPDEREVTVVLNKLTSGRTTRRKEAERLAGTTEALLRQPEDTPDPAAENALDYIKNLLSGFGLDGLTDWAWDQIQQGYSNERIIQNLRETDPYKQRFAGIEARRQAGLPAITEAEYIAYETDVRQAMRAAGLPADFYDQPEDFVNLMANDVSVSELRTRINDGYMAAAQAPAEVRAQLREFYGVGEGDLAAFFLDPDRALPLIQQQYTASQIGGAATRTGYGALDRSEAERLATLGVSEQQAQQGFSALTRSEELFQALPGQQEGLIGREIGQAAVFEGNADAAATLERRAAGRVSAGSGAQSFGLGQNGASGLSRR